MRSSTKFLFRRFIVAIVLTLAGLPWGVSCMLAQDVTPPAVKKYEIISVNGVNPGVYDDRIVFGQSAVFSGPSRQLGEEMRRGILSAFHEANREGGVHGRRLELESLDDGYESYAALANTGELIHVRKVFALIGAVGTPTSRPAFVSAQFSGVPFLGPFTGAEFLRDPELDNILHLRASYYQETEEMIARLTGDLGITRVAVFYQNDSYGQAGLEGTRLALERRGLEPVASGHYERNTSKMHSAVFHIIAGDPEAVIMIGAYAPVAKAVIEVRKEIDPVFMALSFVGGTALAKELGPDGYGVYVTQVVPFPEDTDLPVVAAYQAALAEYDAAAAPGFVSLEGYLAGRLAIAGLELCGTGISRECFLGAIRNAGTIDIGGVVLQYGPGDNQGSDEVFVTVIGADGRHRQVDTLGARR